MHSSFVVALTMEQAYSIVTSSFMLPFPIILFLVTRSLLFSSLYYCNSSSNNSSSNSNSSNSSSCCCSSSRPPPLLMVVIIITKIINGLCCLNLTICPPAPPFDSCFCCNVLVDDIYPPLSALFSVSPVYTT